MNQTLESHRKTRKCRNSKCLSNEREESTTRFTCWYCGAVLEEVKLKK